MLWYSPCSLFASSLWHAGLLSEEIFVLKKNFQTFFPASPLNTEMTVNVSGHFIRDGAAGLSESSLWSAVKSENQLVGFSV